MLTPVSDPPKKLEDSKWSFKGRKTRQERGLVATYKEEMENSWLGR
jgi:hypothetical protein